MSDETVDDQETSVEEQSAAPEQESAAAEAAAAPVTEKAAPGESVDEAEAAAEPEHAAEPEAAQPEAAESEAAAEPVEAEADAEPEAAGRPETAKTTRRERPNAKKAPERKQLAEPGPASAPTRDDGLRGRYLGEVVGALQKEFSYANPMQVPRLSKIVVNIGMGEALTNAKSLDAAVGDLAAITGQKPVITKARRSIAQFRLRTGNPIGVKVTLRGQRMWDFLERLTRLALPRIRDFRGVPSKSFDGRGNYSLGLREQLAFPEIDHDKIDRLRGLEVSIVTTAQTDEESKRLLQLLGMPFAN